MTSGVLFIVGLVLFTAFAIWWDHTHPGLQKALGQLGDVRGRTKSEITDRLGRPNGISATGDGTFLLQWMETRYHVALLFDADDRCLGITSEVSV